MPFRLLPPALRVCARRLHVEFASAGVPAPYHRKRQLIAKREGVLQCGDDACFAMTSGANVALGIADGVGGWRERGFDASFVSLGLMRAAEELVQTKRWDVTDPVRWLADSHELMLERCVTTMMGSSTICLCSLDTSSGELFAANLGDSGLIVLSSSGELRFKSESLQVEFNAPLQLAAPASLAAHYANHNYASFYTKRLSEGDFVILASDGLWDNMHTEEMIALILKEYAANEDLDDVVQKLVLRTKELSKSETFESPFALKARASGYSYKGGKPDDITIVLLTVKR